MNQASQSAESDLNQLMLSINATLCEGEYVFATTTGDYSFTELCPVLVFAEQEGTTLIVRADIAESHDLHCDFRCRMITLNVHSALDAVGFLARITRKLAECNIGVNAVSAFYHDHLFVPLDRAEDAMIALRQLAVEARQAAEES